jgi:predicted RNase H-like HicB family nuclease
MKSYTAIVERDADTGLYVGYVPGFPGAHSQGEALGELRQNLQEVVELLLEEGNLVRGQTDEESDMDRIPGVPGPTSRV